MTDQLKSLEKAVGPTGAALKALMEKAMADSAYVEDRGQRLPGFTYLSAADANKIVAERRKQVRAQLGAAQHTAGQGRRKEGRASAAASGRGAGRGHVGAAEWVAGAGVGDAAQGPLRWSAAFARGVACGRQSLALETCCGRDHGTHRRLPKACC